MLVPQPRRHEVLPPEFVPVMPVIRQKRPLNPRGSRRLRFTHPVHVRGYPIQPTDPSSLPNRQLRQLRHPRHPRPLRPPLVLLGIHHHFPKFPTFTFHARPPNAKKRPKPIGHNPLYKSAKLGRFPNPPQTADCRQAYHLLYTIYRLHPQSEHKYPRTLAVGRGVRFTAGRKPKAGRSIRLRRAVRSSQ